MSFFSGVSVDPSESCFFVGGVGGGVERKCTSLLVTSPAFDETRLLDGVPRRFVHRHAIAQRHRVQCRVDGVAAPRPHEDSISGGRSLFGSFDRKREPLAKVNKGFALVSMFESQKPSTKGVTFRGMSNPRSFFN